MIKMKALRSFGVPGANEGKVKRGREFAAINDHRARELEDHGLAYRLDVAPAPMPITKVEVSPLNKAAETGPLASVGGTTGGEEPVPSSPPDPPLRRRRPPRSKDEDLL